MPQFVDVSSKYGAPMGRAEYGNPADLRPRTVRLYHVRIDRGGYDDGGAYWGIGVPLYCADNGSDYRRFTRALGREMARAQLKIPNPALVRPSY